MSHERRGEYFMLSGPWPRHLSLGYASSHTRRKLPELGRQIATALGNLPLISLMIQCAVDAAAPKAILRLGDDCRPTARGTSE